MIDVYNMLPEEARETDVLIIGSGLAGFAAAYEAAKSGAKALIVEKMPYYGGNSIISGGGFASWDSRLALRQKLAVGEDSWQLHMEDTLCASGGLGNPCITELFAKRAPSAIDWLIEMGVPFRNVLMMLGGYSVPRSYQTAVTSKRMMDIVRENAEALGAELLLSCQVVDLITDSGEVKGAACIYAGSAIHITAKKAVVIASGGFSADVDLRRKYRPELGEKYNCSNHNGATGEILQLAQSIGAELINMECIQLFPSAEPNTGAVDKWALQSYSSPGFGAVYVDEMGNRFVNELEGRDVVSDAQIKLCSKRSWAIFNGEIAEKLLLSDEEIYKGIRCGRLHKGESLVQLAALTGIDGAGLERSVSSHNKLLEGGSDPFGKRPTDFMLPMYEGPYYAISQCRAYIIQ